MAGTELDYGWAPPSKCPEDPFGGKDLTSGIYKEDVNEMGPAKSDLVYGPGTNGHVITDEELAEKTKKEVGTTRKMSKSGGRRLLHQRPIPALENHARARARPIPVEGQDRTKGRNQD